jgi:hypothetical protein
VRTYKFLAAGAVGPFSGFAWPAPRNGGPGAWVAADGPVALCGRGLHLCRPIDLAHWLCDELWEAEAGSELVDGIDCVIAQRARLVRPIDAWQDGGAARFASACIDHAADLVSRALEPARTMARGYVDDAALCARDGLSVFAAFSAAVAVAKLAGAEDQPAAYRFERAWQAGWIEHALIAG